MRAKHLVLSVSLMLGVAAGALTSCGPGQQGSTTATEGFAYGLTAMGAEAFIAKAEVDLLQMGEFGL